MAKLKGGPAFHLLLLTGLFCCIAFTNVTAAEKVGVNALDDGQTGRLALDWGHAEPFSTEMEGGYLYVRFARAFEADFSDVPTMLGKYLGPAEMLEGGQSVRFPVQGKVNLASETREGKIILKFRKKAAVQAAAVAATANVKLRSGEHKEFSRLVFDWPEAGIKHSSRMEGDNLVITFDEPADVNLGTINRYPPARIRNVSDRTDGGKTVVTVAMDHGSRISSFENEKSIVYDIRDGKKAAVKKPEPKEPEVAAAPVVLPKVAPLPATPAAVRQDAPHIASHQADDATGPDTAEKSTKTADAYEAPAAGWTTDPGIAKNGGHDDPEKIASISPASGSAIARIGPTIVLDNPKSSKKQMEKATENDAAPVVHKDSAKDETAAPQHLEEPEQIEAASFNPDKPVHHDGAPALQEGAGNHDTTGFPRGEVAHDSANPAAERLDVHIANLRDGFRLIFPWKQPAAMAMYKNHDAFWIVFDRPAIADFSNLSGPYKFLVPDAEQEPVAGATVLKFKFRDGYVPRVSKVLESWHVDFELGTKVSFEQAISVQEQKVITSGLRLFVPAVQNGEEIRFKDQRTEAEMVIMPLHAAGWGMAKKREFNGIALLQTVQGVVMEAVDASLRISREQNGVSVTAVSKSFAMETPEKREVPKLPGEEMNPVPGLAKADFVKLNDWLLADQALFTQTKQELQKEIAAAKPEDTMAAMMKLAKFYVAHDFYAEASGVLHEMKARFAKVNKDADYKLLAGLAALGLHHLDDAESYLYDGDFDGNAEVAPFRGAVAAEKSNWTRAAQELDYSAPAFGVFPKELQNRFKLLRAEAALRNGKVNVARSTLDGVKGSLDKEQIAAKAYLQGRLAYQLSNFPAAIAHYDQAIRAGYRPVTERARYQKIKANLESKIIKPEEAVKELEALDFAWRGDELEVEVQRSLGRLYEEEGRVGEALAAYKRVVRHFPDSEYAGELGKKMNDLFADLFLNGGADKLPPIKALAIYYQYRELTPVGHKGDKMIQQLADRLTRVDLLEQAAQLLEHQVKFRLKGLEKANVGTRLAIIQLWNKKPEESLKALYKTKWRALSPAAKRERLHIEARAQAGLQHYDEALALLADDESEEADVLRAEVYWKSKNWPEAIPALEHLIGKGHKSIAEDLDRLDRQRIMQLAVARNLANDKAGIRQMRKTYRQKMDGTPDLAAFDLITETNDKSDTDFRKRASVIAEVSQLESFMAGYRQKLEKGDFWATE
ncbi:MAG: hypothetical protein EP348_04210 [Alphaproteobacteria bacterium]|nr:MAG: hypothetical protein EP348_04210 [Alphaproteobacteria bacterium]